MLRRAYLCVVPLFVAAHVAAQINVGSDGSDGAFMFVPDEPGGTTMTVDLSLAAASCDCDGGGVPDDPCTWDCPSPVPGQGVYDAEQWAVVFKYSEVTVATGITVTFKNHETRAPVIWLSQSDIVVSGAISLDGAAGHQFDQSPAHAEPGPGGFRGGRGSATEIDTSAGLGPGGAQMGDGSSTGSGGSYGTIGQMRSDAGAAGPTYGNTRLLPLIGGSGGSPGRIPAGSGGGGAAGGAILVAANDSVIVTSSGQITARGGQGGRSGGHHTSGGDRDGGSGAGGGIRLFGDAVELQAGAMVLATGGPPMRLGGRGGDGRIRFDANSFSIAAKTTPAHTSGSPEFIFPPAGRPIVRAMMLGAESVPSDPIAGFDASDADVTLASADMVDLLIETFNVPIDAPVQVRVTPKAGNAETFEATYTSGDENASTWNASIPLAPGASAIQVRAEIP